MTAASRCRSTTGTIDGVSEVYVVGGQRDPNNASALRTCCRDEKISSDRRCTQTQRPDNAALRRARAREIWMVFPGRQRVHLSSSSQKTSPATRDAAGTHAWCAAYVRACRLRGSHLNSHASRRRAGYGPPRARSSSSFHVRY